MSSKFRIVDKKIHIWESDDSQSPLKRLNYSASTESKTKLSNNFNRILKAAELPEETALDYVASKKPPERTEFFRIRGPCNSAFLIEVYASDVPLIKGEMKNALKDSTFDFDNSVIRKFQMKGILITEPIAKTAQQLNRSKIHAKAAGSEEVNEVEGTDRLQFINSLTNAMKAKKALETLGYKIDGSVCRFQPAEKTTSEEDELELCWAFVKELEEIPYIVSVTHNL